MRLIVAMVLAVVALATGDGAEAGRATVGCDDKSMASFPGAYRGAEDLVVGALSFVGGGRARTTSPASIEQVGGWKSPALVRAGRRVTVSIAPAARGYARLRYAHESHDRPLAALPHTIRFVACGRGERSGSDADGRPVTFWSGFLELDRPSACVPLSIREAGRPARRVTWAVARDC